MSVIAFLSIAVLMTLAAVAMVIVPMLRGGGNSPVAAVVSALAIPAGVVLLYAIVSNYPWSGAPGAIPVPASDQVAVAPLADSEEIATLKEALAQAPRDVQRWVSLGDAYLAQERFAEAREAYRQAIAVSGGGDDALRLSLAEASILADRNALMGEAGQIIDDVLFRDPFNPKALWYGGMAALGRGDTDTAVKRWSKLLELSPPPRIRQIIEQQLAGLGASVPAAGSGSTPAPGPRIPVRVALQPELAGRVKPGAALFLIARDSAAKGPPLAVVRRDAVTLPLDLEISDADSMVPGRSLAGLAEVRLVARIANDGEALAAPGDVFGEATWRPAAGRVEILIDKVTP